MRDLKLPTYAKYLFEVIAIFVGISLSFMMDEWREDPIGLIAAHFFKNSPL